MKKNIEKIIGRKISDEKIKESIVKYNNFKKILSMVNKLKIKGSKKLEIYQKAILFGPEIQPQIEEFIKQNKKIIDSV